MRSALRNKLLKAGLSGAAAFALAAPGSAAAQDVPVDAPAVAQDVAGEVEASAGGCAHASAAPAQAGIAAVRSSTLCLLNIERSRRGLRPLKANRKLRRAAARHARDMDARNYFNHNSLGGSSFVDRIRRAGYLRGARSWVVGENLAWGTSTLASPRSIMRAWMNSPGHRANILNRRFKEIGVGISLGAPQGGHSNGATYATSFGARG